MRGARALVDACRFALEFSAAGYRLILLLVTALAAFAAGRRVLAAFPEIALRLEAAGADVFDDLDDIRRRAKGVGIEPEWLGIMAADVALVDFSAVAALLDFLGA